MIIAINCLVSLQNGGFSTSRVSGPLQDVRLLPLPSYLPPCPRPILGLQSTSLIQERQDSDLGHVAFAVETASHGLVRTMPPKFSAARLGSFQKHREDGCSHAVQLRCCPSIPPHCTCDVPRLHSTMHRQRLSPRSSLGHSSRTDTPKRGCAARVLRHAGGTLGHSKACCHIGFHGRDEKLRRAWEPGSK